MECRFDRSLETCVQEQARQNSVHSILSWWCVARRVTDESLSAFFISRVGRVML